jgi:asparagine synthetase B (glutamine-hydrolysing)
MCGFLVYRVSGDNSRVRLRGQDQTNVVTRGGLTFVHDLLWVTGQLTVQPYLDGDIACVYNGEIYNHKFSRSDGEVLIPLYREHGPTFAKHLDGEFAIALYDFERGIAVFSTDPFGTKPMFVNGVECASYRSGVGGERVTANKVRVTRLSDGLTLEENELHAWDFDHQTTDSYDPWIKAFDAAIAKRAVPECFLGLSSGYDSGAIACSLLKAGVPFKAFAFQGREDRVVLEARLALCSRYELFEPEADVKKQLTDLYGVADNEKYTIYYDNKETTMRLLDDGGIYGVATYSKFANEEGRKVALSGQGADEILSDYSLFPGQSEFRGKFPSKLARWRNFDRGCQESYLLKEEYAGGAFSIEARYPFLDRELVGAFLKLTPKAKNAHYKAPLREYLTRNRFPFKEGEKVGFSVEL